jgi:hypothetical protein
MVNRSKRKKLTKPLQTLSESVIAHRGQTQQKVPFPISSQVPLTTRPPFQFFISDDFQQKINAARLLRLAADTARKTRGGTEKYSAGQKLIRNFYPPPATGRFSHGHGSGAS